MIHIDASYLGELRCQAVHLPSGAELVTDAPRDNHGRGEAFSPTDSLATALLTCMLTVMGILASKSGWALAGMTGRVAKHMTDTTPRRVAKLVVVVSVPVLTAEKLDAQARNALIDVAENCPVRLSLAEAVVVETSYRFGDA